MICILAAAVIIAALLWFFSALSGVRRGQGEEGRRQLEDALRRAAVACYAAEGIYPPDAEYMAEHYGVQIDEERYTVFYEIFALIAYFILLNISGLILNLIIKKSLLFQKMNFFSF